MKAKHWVVAGIAATLTWLPSQGQAAIEKVSTYTGESTPAFQVQLSGRFTSGAAIDESGTEIVAYDQANEQAYSINGAENALDIIDLAPLKQDASFQELPLKKRIPISDVSEDLGDVSGITSVALHPDGDYLAVAIVAEPKTDPGHVVFLTTDGELLATVGVGSLPDMLTFTHDGSKLLVANEGEPNDAYDVNPEGSVSVVDLSEGIDSLTNSSVNEVTFDQVDIDEDVRQVNADATRAEDLEPEYIVVSEDDTKAYVALQENNAIATLDLTTASFTSVKSLGFKDHSIAGNGMDVNDEDGKINIQTVPVLGQYMPDGISLLERNGKSYILTPNEGDAQDYEGFSEEVRVADIADQYALNAEHFEGYTQEELDALVEDGLFDDDQLGRLKTTTSAPKNEDGKYEAVYSYGARSFTIFDAETMEPVFDSGDTFEQVIAKDNPEMFNTTNSENVFDDRSDDKGPEPESVTTGQIGDKTYAFVGLEREGSIAVYDVTNPEKAAYVTMFNSRDFSGSEVAGDVAPEGLAFVTAEESITGEPMLLVGNEVSGTMSVFTFGTGNQTDAEGQTTLQIIHFNDVHARVFDEENGGMGYAKLKTIIDQKEAENANTLVLDAGDTLHGTTFATLMKGESIVQVLNAIGVDAMAPGNHDFNYGNDHLQALRGMMEFPVLTANVKASDGTDVFQPYEIQEIDGIKVGIFGLATPETTFKTHPNNVKGLTFEDPVVASKRMVQELQAQDVDVIIALAHLGMDEASKDTSTKVAQEVAGIDLIVDGHSHTTLETGMDAANGTLIVSTGEYLKNVGVVELTFEGDELVQKDAELISKEDAANVVPSEDIVSVTDEITASQEVILQEEVGTTDVRLDGEREQVRVGETNLGNLITDAMLATTGAEIALTNGGGIRASIEAGTVTKGDVVTVLPFGNYIVTKEVTGEQLVAALENGVSDYPEPKGAFPHVAGMTFAIDPAQPAGARVHSVEVAGEPLKLDQTYMLATNDFLAAGGDEYTSLSTSPIANEYDALDEALIAHMQGLGQVAPAVEGRITEAAMVQAPSAPTQPTPAPSTGETYIVQAGDTLYDIGLKHGTTWQALQQLNQLANPHWIQIGQVIELP
ncbi:choice-of-anchor I family protein [Aureibacillus halotolerans]|uniref:2',3'-cyclic-nucleotide 2'-phosphodiesterase (5'-nucleotidase family) n=1 Tax=Aureibacillus halotolerans TaxID=1508390 RepID=A0A4R6UAC0_9BACI|nr:choice-of-anchor I family protein [Aureibacillus halotolerans]TDQ41983.1 2',3'-cyclic-nucleotide 2'-phosphodiesterase (5'-nucleotidase family) [Aureibacillus halotolerans]